MALATLAAPAVAVAALAAFGAMSDEAEPGLGSLPAAEGLQGATVAAEPSSRPRAKPTPVKERKGESRLASRDMDRRRTRAPDPVVKAPKAPTEAPDANGGPGAGFTPGPAPTQPQPATATDYPGSVPAPSSGSSGSGGSGSEND